MPNEVFSKNTVSLSETSFNEKEFYDLYLQQLYLQRALPSHDILRVYRTSPSEIVLTFYGRPFWLTFLYIAVLLISQKQALIFWAEFQKNNFTGLDLLFFLGAFLLATYCFFYSLYGLFGKITFHLTSKTIQIQKKFFGFNFFQEKFLISSLQKISSQEAIRILIPQKKLEIVTPEQNFLFSFSLFGQTLDWLAFNLDDFVKQVQSVQILPEKNTQILPSESPIKPFSRPSWAQEKKIEPHFQELVSKYIEEFYLNPPFKTEQIILEHYETATIDIALLKKGFLKSLFLLFRMLLVNAIWVLSFVAVYFQPNDIMWLFIGIATFPMGIFLIPRTFFGIFETNRIRLSPHQISFQKTFFGIGDRITIPFSFLKKVALQASFYPRAIFFYEKPPLEGTTYYPEKTWQSFSCAIHFSEAQHRWLIRFVDEFVTQVHLFHLANSEEEKN